MVKTLESLLLNIRSFCNFQATCGLKNWMEIKMIYSRPLGLRTWKSALLMIQNLVTCPWCMRIQSHLGNVVYSFACTDRTRRNARDAGSIGELRNR